VVLNEDDALASLAESPVEETRMGKHAKSKDVESLRRVIKVLTKGTEGLTISTNKAGQFIVTVGTYDLVPINTGGGGGGGGHFQGGYQSVPNMHQGMDAGGRPTGPTLTSVYNPTMYWVPGNSSYMSTSARYYKTTYFRMLLDPRTLQPAHGRVTNSVGEQVKDYMDDWDAKTSATKQFAIKDKQYYGRYDKDGLAYIVEEIMIRK